MNLESLKDLTARNTTQGKPCLIARTISGLPEEYKLIVNDLLLPLDEGGISSERVAVAFRNAGLQGGTAAIYRHRLGTCTCGTNIGETN